MELWEFSQGMWQHVKPISLQDKIFSRTGYINTMLREVVDVKHLLDPTA